MSEAKLDRIRIFCLHARSLSQDEVSSIPTDQRQKMEAGDKGVWLEVSCPEEKCLVGDHEIKLEMRGFDARKKEGFWHKVFCPEDRCFAESASDLP